MEQFEKGIFITATDTEVGKTFVSGLLMRTFLQQGKKAGYFKPIASGCQSKEGALLSEDLLHVESFTNTKMDHNLHCPVRYSKPLAPLAAARLEKRPVNLESIWESFERLKQKYSCLVVEGIGGVMVPLKKDYLVLDMMADIKFPALVVCRPALGTINHTLLTIQAIKNKGIPLLGFLTNGSMEKEGEAARTSPGLISSFSSVSYLGHIPIYEDGSEEPDDFIEQHVSFLKGILEEIP